MQGAAQELDHFLTEAVHLISAEEVVNGVEAAGQFHWQSENPETKP